MKMIDVLNMMSEGKIKEGTKLEIGYKIYNYINDYTESENCSFVNQEDDRTELLEDNELITTDFLNLDVELIPPKPKKYLVKFNMRGLRNDMNYLNYNKDNEHVSIFDKSEWSPVQTKFTEKEMQSIKVVREFLQDMEGKYELIEAGVKN